jgi:hypothetical protein
VLTAYVSYFHQKSVQVARNHHRNGPQAARCREKGLKYALITDDSFQVQSGTRWRTPLCKGLIGLKRSTKVFFHASSMQEHREVEWKLWWGTSHFGGAQAPPCLRWLSSHSLAMFQHVQGWTHANHDLIYSSRDATFATFQSSVPSVQVVNQ